MAHEHAALSRLVADDLKRAERACEQAVHDSARFVMTAIDVFRSAKKDVSVAAALTGPAIEAMSAAALAQKQFSTRVHTRALAIASDMGLIDSDFGGSDGKGGHAISAAMSIEPASA